MGGCLRPLSYTALVTWAVEELERHGSVFDIPRSQFHIPSGRRDRALIGPAAGPHTQLAQNILSAWLCGARYFELKTVQVLDSLKLDKPCIDAADEGYNVEWSTELSLAQAYDEYLKAWFLIHLLKGLPGGAVKTATGGASGAGGVRPIDGQDDCVFNMSVGYDLAGIKTEKMDAFISRLIDSSKDPLYARYREESVILQRRFSLGAAAPAPGAVCASVTLSTMHGCPPGEIESICAYLMTEKKLDTLVKLNPTLLGYDRALEILSSLGFKTVMLSEEGFRKDLPYADAIPMLKRLLALSRREGRRFGVKLSNTLAVANTAGRLPGKEMYMSGRALYPLTVSLAARLAEDFMGELPMSFCGGISARNVSAIIRSGIRPITLATDLLKPGGYGRLRQLAVIAGEEATGVGGAAEAVALRNDTDVHWLSSRIDVPRLKSAAASALSDPAFSAEESGRRTRSARPLPLVDCFASPCTLACPISQDVPAYIREMGRGRPADALAAVYDRNPLPFITGYLCDHACVEACARRSWEGPVKIREMKRISAERGYDELRKSPAFTALKADARGVSAAVVGAGPAGLAAAGFLSREGFEVHVFEREREPGGVISHVLPGFRVPSHAVEKDVSLLLGLGVHFHFSEGAVSVGALQHRGFRYVLVAVGAQVPVDIGITGAVDALGFLRNLRAGEAAPHLGRYVVVIGAGDTAMDAARAAARCPGVERVTVVYRRSEAQMPASEEEYKAAKNEGIRFLFLRSPESWERDGGLSDIHIGARLGPSLGRLVCRVMAQGPADESGRPRPVATDTTETVDADSIITAAGVRADARALSSLGIDGEPDHETQETKTSGVFLIGDAASGGETIVKAIASAHRASDAIVQREGGSRIPASGSEGAAGTAEVEAVRARRGGLIARPRPQAEDQDTVDVEARRCLECSRVCLACVEACPNRANAVVAVAGLANALQIVHIDALCNDCGNCDSFCPWSGKPHEEKLTLFATEEDFASSRAPGFFVRGAEYAIRVGGVVENHRLDEPAEDPAASREASARAVVKAVAAEHPYLLGG